MSDTKPDIPQEIPVACFCRWVGRPAEERLIHECQWHIELSIRRAASRPSRETVDKLVEALRNYARVSDGRCYYGAVVGEPCNAAPPCRFHTAQAALSAYESETKRENEG